jgi:hypothetical protein
VSGAPDHLIETCNNDNSVKTKEIGRTRKKDWGGEGRSRFEAQTGRRNMKDDSEGRAEALECFSGAAPGKRYMP